MIRITKEFIRNLSAATITKAVMLLMLVIFLGTVYYINDAEDVPMAKIEKALKKDSPIAELKKRNTRELMEYMGVDFSKYDEVLYYKSHEALNVSELMIVKVKSKSQLNDVQDAVEARIKEQVDTYVDYGPEQVAMVDNAVVLKRGKYLFYCVAKDPEKYEEVFRRVI